MTIRIATDLPVPANTDRVLALAEQQWPGSSPNLLVDETGSPVAVAVYLETEPSAADVAAWRTVVRDHDPTVLPPTGESQAAAGVIPPDAAASLKARVAGATTMAGLRGVLTAVIDELAAGAAHG